jgi:heme/copper-type cytochrome/quinol oxidase subunit 2
MEVWIWLSIATVVLGIIALVVAVSFIVFLFSFLSEEDDIGDWYRDDR